MVTVVINLESGRIFVYEMGTRCEHLSVSKIELGQKMDR